MHGTLVTEQDFMITLSYLQRADVTMYGTPNFSSILRATPAAGLRSKL